MKTVIRNLKLAVCAGLLMGMNASRTEANLANSLYELATFGQSMGSFTNNLNQLLHTRSPQEQQEIQQRLQYVEQQSVMQTYTLESFIAADEAMAASAGRWSNYFGMGGDDQAITALYQSFKQYQSMFSQQILRATGQFPMANYERLFMRWQQTPATNPSLKEQAKQQFLQVFRSFARQFIYMTQEQLRRKQARFMDALKKIERSGPFAMGDKTTFDKAFWDYQSMFSNMVEPKYGQIFLPEFPYNQALVSQQQPNFVYNQAVYAQSGLNQFGYGATTGMGYQMGMSSMNGMSGMGMSGMGMNSGFATGMVQQNQGRYSTSSSSVQANQVVPLGNSSQLSSPYGAFAPSTSEGLDARLIQEMYQKQKQYEASANVHDQNDLSEAYADYMKLRDQWFSR